MQRAINDALTLGGTFIDIGANVGFFTLIGARLVGPAGTVYAFEPVPRTAEALRSNVALNDLSQVTIYDCAVAEQTATMRVAVGDSDQVAHIVEGPGEGDIDVRGVALDDLNLEVHEKNCVVKIDAEGAEYRVLLGMRNFVSRVRPTILCELHTMGRRAQHPVTDLLLDMGYVIDWLGGPSSDGWAPHLAARPAERMRSSHR